MGVVVSPPPPKTDSKFDDWMYLFWKRLLNAIGIPAGGDTNQVLTKASPTSYDVTWTDVASGGIPTGGFTGDVLTKLSDTSYDADWSPPPDILKPPANNIVHNSNFQVRDIANQEIVSFATSAPYNQHIRRWYGIAATADFETRLETSLEFPRVTIKRVAGTNTDYVRLIQILDIEDSLKWANRGKAARPSIGHKSGANISEINLVITTGEGINESLDDYINGLWTNQTEVYNENVFLGGNPTDLTFDQITQIAVEIQVKFTSTASATNDEVYLIHVIVDDPGLIFWEVDDKSFAVVQRECQRYYQKLELYLTTSEISVPISMRDVPAVTLGDAAAFTTTGTTADVLIIKVNGAGDNGMHTVYLDCEL